MIIERSLHPQFLSNTYLVADGQGGPAFFVDAGGPVEPLIAAAERLGVTPTHVLLTHHHFDHVSEVGALRERWPKLEVADPPAGARARGGGAEQGTGTIEPGEALRFGALEVRPLLHARPHRGDAVVPRRRCRPAARADARGPRAPRPAASPAAKGWCSPATPSSAARSAACARPATRPTPI